MKFMYVEAVGTLPPSGMSMLSVKMIPPCSGTIPVELRVGEIGDVAGPRHRGREVPFGQGRRVVVAVELADLP